jgi:hypothetical protein
MADEQTLAAEVAAWVAKRNAHHATVDQPRALAANSNAYTLHHE